MRDALDIQVDLWMKQFAAIDDREHALPDPSIIWMKAKLLQSRNDVQRATRPIAIFEIASQAVVAACWAAMLTWKWGAITAWIEGLRPASLVTAQSAVSLPFLMSVAILGIATVMVAMHSVLAEE